MEKEMAFISYQKIYKNFYKHRDTADLSSRVIVPMLINLLHPKSVVDVGCGNGIFLQRFLKLGVNEIVGIDGPWVTHSDLKIPAETFLSVNLNNPPFHKKRFDIALSLEVAEHLHPQSSNRFVKYLTQLSDMVVFSAAIPGQGGVNHLNEQWQSYWAKKFIKLNYLPYDFLRPRLWNQKRVSFWYAQNLIIYVKKNKQAIIPEEPQTNLGYLDIIHPVLYKRKQEKHPIFLIKKQMELLKRY